MLGTELQMQRMALGLTQQELADHLDAAKNTIARWERGELRIERGAMLRYALSGLALKLGKLDELRKVAHPPPVAKPR